MSISDIGLFQALKTRMNWLQHRQGVLAENVANADTPGYRARDLKALGRHGPAVPGAPSAQFGPIRTDEAHLSLGRVGRASHSVQSDSFEVTPSGNSVVLEEEMMKVSATQLDYQLVTGLYGRGIGMLKTALGRGG